MNHRTSEENRSTEAVTVEHSDADDVKQNIIDGLCYRDHIIHHLQQSLQPGGTLLRVIKAPYPKDAHVDEDRRTNSVTTQTLVSILPTAEIVLWRSDIMTVAENQAERFADLLVPVVDLPRKHEVWYMYGTEAKAIDLDGTKVLALQILLSGAALGTGEWATLIAFYFPLEDNVLRLDQPPVVQIIPLLDAREPASNIDTQRLFSCLSFRGQPFVDVAAANIHHTRAERRRMERENRVFPAVRVINLRRREPTKKEKADNLHRADFQCQFIVTAHVRRPNPRMKEQRPIWVSSYIKGPKDMPLKPPTRTVIAVSR